MKILKLVLALLLAAALAGCPSTPKTYYSIGGTVSGLNGTVVLTLDANGTENPSITSNGTFTFTTSIESGKNATVSVSGQPTNQLCSVSNGSITSISANITNVTVTCVTQGWRVSTGTANMNLSLPQAQWTENPTNRSFLTNPYQLYFSQYDGLLIFFDSSIGQTWADTIRTSDSRVQQGYVSGQANAVSTSVGSTIYYTENGSILINGSRAVFSNANLNSPLGMVADASGNLYVADSGNHVIKKIDTSGAMSVFAGTLGNAGGDNGQGTAAKFNYPTGMAIDSRGNLYVADMYGPTIRKISSTGLVSTLAGSNGQFGSDDGTGLAARFNLPQGVAVDTNGNVYVADTYNNRIRKITSDGVVTTLAGHASGPNNPGYADGALTDAKFDVPTGIAVDSDGTIYVADKANNALRRIKYGPVP